MAKANQEIIDELPFGDGGKLIDLGGVNFRFNRTGRLFQIYALRESIPIEHGLVLNRSTIREFEIALGTEFEEFTGANGSTQFRCVKNGIEIRVIPAKNNPGKAFSVMLTKGD